MLRVSKLTLRGFKSFGKPTAIDFPKGFTSVVGPNGSGKSNIIDAICFVLGRLSSKSLRADRMSELIFTGSKVSKSSTRAEVGIRFDNTERDLPIDASSVEVTREILKNGNSGYYLNGKKTTRQQIVDILSKAQINPNGHNIILQGDVAEIIDMNPVERREIMDEISGIAEYESKKQRALGELQKVENKTEEARAVYRERERYLQEIEKERDAALRYQRVSDELKQRRAELFKVKIDKTDTELSRISGKMESEEKKKAELQAELDERENEIKELDQQVRGIDEELQKKGEKERAEITRDVQKCRIKITEAEKDLESNATNSRRMESTLQQTQETEKELSGKEERIGIHLEKLETESRVIGKELEEKQGSARSLQDKAIGAGKEKTRQLEIVRSRLLKETEKLHQLEKEREKTSEFLRVKKTELNELKDTEKGSGPESERVNSEKKRLENRLDEINRKVSELADQIAGLDRQRTNASIDVRKLEHEISLKRREHSRKEAESSAQKDQAGFGEAIKEIMNLKGSGTIKGIYGTVAELGQVNEKYSLALKTAAGSRLQNIVVENEDTAIKCINHLKRERKGRATFLPLNRLRSRGAEKAPKEAIGLAIDLVSFEPIYRPAFQHVFTDTILVESLETAKRIGIGKRRTVTLEGDLAETSGAMTGGHQQRKGGKGFSIKELGEETELLSKELESMETEKEKKEHEHARIKEELFSLQGRESGEKGEIEKTKKVLEGLQIKMSSLKDISERIERVEGEIREAEEKNRELGAKIEEAKKGVDEIKNSSDRILQETKKKDSEEFTGLLEKTEHEVKETEKKWNEIQTGIKLARSELEQVIRKGLEESRKNIESLVRERKRIEEHDERLNRSLEELGQNLTQLQEEEKKYLANSREMLKKKQRAQSEIDKLREKISKKRAKMSDIQKLITDHGLEKARIEQRMSDIKLEGKDYEAVEVEITHSEKELERTLIRLDKEREKIGHVNMLAIDSFDKIKEDFESLKEKLSKLEEEKQAVLDFMTEVEKNKKETFMKTFLAISEQFERTFAKLSPGGEAHLVLENPEEVFTEGMLIKAKPKGKELSNIEQMSGGEKTMTALAFIFAIQQSNPAPFYVLDEVDAALDEANSITLGEMVSELSGSGTAQFIVISHNSAVFSRADQLYGVTMTETGSQIVGVDMK